MNLFNWISIHLVFRPEAGGKVADAPPSTIRQQKGVEVKRMENLISLITNWFDITIR